MTNVNELKEPPSVKEALISLDKAQWLNVMEKNETSSCK